MARVVNVLTVLATALLFSAGGCSSVDEGPACCPPEIVEVMIVRAFDITGKEITISESVKDGCLFFFNENLKLMNNGYIIVEEDKLGREKALPDSVLSVSKPGDKLRISAWGNIVGSFNVYAEPEWGDDISREFLAIIPNDLYDGYYSCPGEILFGMRDIVLGEKTDPTLDRWEIADDGTIMLVHEVHITHLNSLLYIQVEDLPDSVAEDYYFRISRQNNGYNYEGEAFAGDELRHIRETGEFDNRDYLITPTPYNLVPSIDADSYEDITEDNAVHLHLMKTGTTRAEDVDLTGAVSKVDYGDGNFIGLYPGQTTNVFIRFKDGGTGGPADITVEVRVTPWGEIYQQSEW